MMKSFFTVLIAASVISCSWNDYTLFPGNVRDNGQGWNGRSYGHDGTAAVEDSAVFVCGVKYPEGCEWRIDSCRTGVSAELVLFRNGELLLSLPAGMENEISDEPDMHHLLGGHLYTEYSSLKETIVKCDGKELLRYPGREFLRGLLVEDDRIYTLGQSRIEEGFSLRCNGELLIERKTGAIEGGFGSFNYDGNGALFRDDGRLCFRFRFNSEQFLMADGAERPYSENLVRDSHEIKYFSDTHLWYSGPGYPSPVLFTDDNRFIMHNGLDLDGRYYFFPPEGGCFAEGDFYLAMTPMENGARPGLWKNGAFSGMDFNGYLTGVEVLLSPGDSS